METLPYLSEHEARPPRETRPDAAVYQPTADEEKRLKYVLELFQKCKRQRDNYDKKWPDYYKFFRGKQWPDYRPSWRHSDVINLVFQAIQSIAPLESDSRPQFQFVPEEPSDTEFAQIMNEVAESDWERGNWMLPFLEVIYDKYIFGTGLSSLEFNPDGDYGAGEIEFLSEDPFYCFPDPDARDVNVKSKVFFKIEPMDITEARKRWPKHAAHIKSDTSDVFGGASRTDITPINYQSTVDRRMIITGEQPEEYAKSDRVLVISCWERSDETEILTEDELGEDGKPKLDEAGVQLQRQVTKLKFPTGRKTVIANSIILEDGPNEYDDGEIPFQRVQNYMLPREFWGISEIEQLEGPQKIYNKIMCFILDVLTLTGNPIWIIPTDSNVDTDNLFNRPGDILEPATTAAAQGIRREAGTQLQPYVMQLLDRVKGIVESMPGAQDVTRGVNPGGVTAMGAIEALQEAAQTRTRLKLRLIDAWLKCVGRQYASRVMQYYTAPRIFRLKNAEGAEKYFKFHVSRNEQGEPVARVSPFVQNNGEWVETEGREYAIRGKLDVRPTTGSGLPFAKAEKKADLFKMFELGIIDEEEVLNGLEYPNAKLIIERIKARQAQQAQQAPAA